VPSTALTPFHLISTGELVLSVAKAAETAELIEFFSQLYKEQEGFVYLALKSPTQQASWKQEFYSWPGDAEKLALKITESAAKFEVYFGPALYAEKKAQKVNVLGSHCFWVEFDGTIPDSIDGIPEPTIRIQSSSEGHQHWYWLTDSLLGVAEIERINRSLATSLGADISGWDSTQVLRPPSTYNHKRSAQVNLLGNTSKVYGVTDFAGLPEVEFNSELAITGDIPDVTDVVASYKFKADAWQLFRKGVPQGSRSEGLMALGFHLAEMQMKNEEILSMLLNADQRWGKFAGRNDQVRRLTQIVTIARNKYPLLNIDPVGRFETYGFISLLNSEINLEWVWEGLLQEAGYLLITGPPGVGKTQFSLNFAQYAALGRDFLERKIEGTRRIGFVSLEMGHADLKFFISHQSGGFVKEELELLEENLKFLPLGEPLYLSKESERDALEEWVYENKLTGVVIDSLGSTTENELSNEHDVKIIMDFNDRLRQRHNCFTTFVHHHRKATGDNKKPNKLSDVYGNQYITARATTVLCLWEGPSGETLSVIPLKVRLAKKPQSFDLTRGGDLHFTLKTGVTKAGMEFVAKKKEEAEKEKDEEGPKIGKGKKGF
jgi:nucleoside-triphosphatase THEP1